MNLTLATSLFALTTAAGSFAVVGLQDKPARDTMPKQGGDIAQKMKELGTPGADHRVLEGRVGSWDVDVKMFEPGSTTPMSSKGKSTVKWVMDGRFLEESVQGDWMGQPFSGTGYVGYDNLKKKYVSTWIDNMGTGIGYVEGTYDAATKTFTFAGDVPDMIQNKYSKMRMIDKTTDADHWTAQMYSTGPDGKEFQSMEIVYTRAK